MFKKKVKTCLLVTGASKGIGKTIAVEFSKLMASGSTIILTARNIEGLQSTKKEISSDIHVTTVSMDLENISENEITELCKLENTIDFQQIIVVHNAGSLGDLTKWSLELDSLKEIENYFRVNLFSMILINNTFLKQFPKETKKLLINITSLWAIQPSQNFVLYCCGKATREMYFKVVAEENPDLSVLNYSPGPVKTDMADEILVGIRHQELKDMFLNMRTSGRYLTCEETVTKLIQVINAGKFESGAHIDYFDPLQ